ncbi:MAG: class I SAM-dependent methyltransferase [Pseudonocardiaceae bacterium]
MALGKFVPRGGVGTWARRAVQAGLLAGLVLDTVQLRRWLAALRPLPERPEPATSPERAESPTLSASLEHLLVVAAENVRIDPATLAAARAHARAEGLSALDLVPADLPVAQAFDLLHGMDPGTYRNDRQAPGRGALHATLVDDGLLRAVGSTPQRPTRTAPELAETIAQLKLHAPAGLDLALAPHLTSDDTVLTKDAEAVAALHGPNTTAVLLPQLAWLGTLAASCLFGRRWALAALGAWSVQPLAVFAGSPSLRPADLWSYSATRVVAEPRRITSALGAARTRQAGLPDPVEQRRPSYQAELAQGVERFFEPRRTDCPWCSSNRLTVALRTRDLLQHKPGSFTLNRCGDCGHVFQNPRLSPAGLDFYYRDFYDGLGEQALDRTFRMRKGLYLQWAATLQGVAQPTSWLDVGTGHGHFCNAAREVWPQTSFDGLDISEGIKLAEHRGWIERGYRGSFVDLSQSMTGRYDVVSMFHYLEHSREPQQELEAARTALRAGGHLLIEVPDPESTWGRWLGKWWLPWLQPQHLNFVPAGNLRRRLEQLGFTVVLEQHAQAHDPADLVWAMLTRLNDLTTSGEDLPWRQTKPRRSQPLVRTATFAAGVPALLAARAADRLLAPLAPRLRCTNAYRMLARKD